jgi:hypothetical protein
MTRIIALLALVLASSTAFAIDIKDEIILEWSSGLVYRWYCLGEKEGTINAEDEKMMEGIDRTTAAYFLAAMKIQWSKQPEEFCGAMRCGQTGACD